MKLYDLDEAKVASIIKTKTDAGQYKDNPDCPGDATFREYLVYVGTDVNIEDASIHELELHGDADVKSDVLTAMLGEGGGFNPSNMLPQLPGMSDASTAKFFNAPKPKAAPKPKIPKDKGTNNIEKVQDTPVAAMGSLRSTLASEVTVVRRLQLVLRGRKFGEQLVQELEDYVKRLESMHQDVSGQLSNDDLSWACFEKMRVKMKHDMDAHKELVDVAKQMERGTGTKPAKNKKKFGASEGGSDAA